MSTKPPYSEKQKTEIMDRICEYISNGESLRQALEYHDMPTMSTFYTWIDPKESDSDVVKELKANRAKQYARATKERADALVDQMLEIADDNKLDVSVDADGKWNVSGEVVQRSKLRVDTRKWIAARMNPKKYGEASLLKLADPSGDPLKINALFPTDILHVPSDDGTKKDSSP